DVIVIARREKIAGKLLSAAALFGFQDHGPPSDDLPRARRSSVRRADTSRQASLRSASVSGVTGREPVFTALASWFRLEESRDCPKAPRTRPSASRSPTGLLPLFLRGLAASPNSFSRICTLSGLPPRSASSRALSSCVRRRENGGGYFFAAAL